MRADPLQEHDLEVSRRDPPAEKLAQALELMESGFRLKRAALQHIHPDASKQQLEEAMTRWLCSED